MGADELFSAFADLFETADDGVRPDGTPKPKKQTNRDRFAPHTAAFEAGWRAHKAEALAVLEGVGSKAELAAYIARLRKWDE